jgi:hypothetical protein
MEVLTLAFDTVMIGLFALPRLLVRIDLEQPDLLNSSDRKRLTAYLPAELRPPAIALTLFSLVYLLASWITPLSRVSELSGHARQMAAYRGNDSSL